MIDLNDNATVAELARQQSIETGEKVYAVCDQGRDAVYIKGEMCRWGYLDDIEITYGDEDAAFWEQMFHGTKH